MAKRVFAIGMQTFSDSAICGYTDDDLDTVFAAELPGLDREAICEWYNDLVALDAERA